MQGFVPHVIPPVRPRRRIVGSAFRVGGAALAVAPTSGTVPIRPLVPRQRSLTPWSRPPSAGSAPDRP